MVHAVTSRNRHKPPGACSTRSEKRLLPQGAVGRRRIDPAHRSSLCTPLRNQVGSAPPLSSKPSLARGAVDDFVLARPRTFNVRLLVWPTGKVNFPAQMVLAFPTERVGRVLGGTLPGSFGERHHTVVRLHQRPFVSDPNQRLTRCGGMSFPPSAGPRLSTLRSVPREKTVALWKESFLTRASSPAGSCLRPD